MVTRDCNMRASKALPLAGTLFLIVCRISQPAFASALINLSGTKVFFPSRSVAIQQQHPSKKRWSFSTPYVHTSCFMSTQKLDSSTESGEKLNKPTRLSRSERKAFERAKKHQEKQIRQKKRHAAMKDKSRYDLHSVEQPRLTKNSTTDDVMRAIKRAQKLHDEHDIRNIERFLLEEVDSDFAYGYRGSLLARLAVAALHMSNHDLARKALEVRRTEYRSSMLPMESAAIIRGMLRVHNVTDAVQLLNDELSLPLEGTPLDTRDNKERIKHRALAIASIASRHFYEGEPIMAIKACQMLAELGPIVRQSDLKAEDVNMPWRRIIQGASQCEAGIRDGTVLLDNCDENQVSPPCNLVYSVLNAMTTFPAENDDEVYEALSNALVRRTVFVTGAVSMSGLPSADRGEAAFIGRSNVGKSSLVNMITNRKSLAYTSKRPGKTQQFNFFAVNDKPDLKREIKYGDVVPGQKDRDSFYIVDLPGFGYAKVPQERRREWAEFMKEYMEERKTLRVLFHLVDARHGPIDEDLRIMRQVRESLPKHVNYVVVLTKADKNVKDTTKKAGRVSIDVMSMLREAMRNAKVGNAPVILTSAETKLGRDDIWRYLRLAAET